MQVDVRVCRVKGQDQRVSSSRAHTADTTLSNDRTVAGSFESDGWGLVRVLGREPQRDCVGVTLIDGTL